MCSDWESELSISSAFGSRLFHTCQGASSLSKLNNTPLCTRHACLRFLGILCSHLFSSPTYVSPIGVLQHSLSPACRQHSVVLRRSGHRHLIPDSQSDWRLNSCSETEVHVQRYSDEPMNQVVFSFLAEYSLCTYFTIWNLYSSLAPFGSVPDLSVALCLQLTLR